MVDLREVGERSAGRYIAHDLKDLAFQLSRFESAHKLVERLRAGEREKVRIEAVMRIGAALDSLGQRNTQLHKERQQAPWAGQKTLLGAARSSNAHSERLFPGAPRRSHSRAIRCASAI
jgi:hypothetical protein